MAIQVVESFDVSQSITQSRGWTTFTGGDVSTALARTGSASMLLQDSGLTGYGAALALNTAVSTVIVGCAFYYSGTPSANGQEYILALREGSTHHLYLKIDTTNNYLGIYRGADDSKIGEWATAILSSTWYYIELKATIHDTTGSVELKVDGTSHVTVNSIDTRNGGTGVVDSVRFQQFRTDTATRFDDIYIADTTGTQNNDFLGPVSIYTLAPDAVGNSSQWTPQGGGDNYLEVDEIPPDNDTTYVESSTTGHKDTYGFSNLSSSPTSIFGVQVSALGRQTLTGSRRIQTVVRSGATELAGAATDLPSSYDYVMEMYETDPDTGLAWTTSGVNTAEFGAILET